MSTTQLGAGYDFEYCGECLGQFVPSGAKLMVEPSAPIQPGDIVSVILREAEGPFAGFVNGLGSDFAGVCKIYLGYYQDEGSERVYVVGQLFPPLVSPIPAHAIEALHKVVDGALPDDAEGGLCGSDEAALDLIMRFSNGAGTVPINPFWAGVASWE